MLIPATYFTDHHHHPETTVGDYSFTYADNGSDNDSNKSIEVDRILYSGTKLYDEMTKWPWYNATFKNDLVDFTCIINITDG